MGLTGKQVRNGITSEAGERGGTAPTDWTAKTSSAKGAAETYGNDWQQSGKAVFDGSTAGESGYGVKDFDANIAMTEAAGEA